MSGGHFDYQQCQGNNIADEIDQLIKDNDRKDKNDWGDVIGRHYPQEIIVKFREAAYCLRRAAEMAQRVDWLVSCDDGPDTFIERWDNEVRPAYKEAE